jgi:DNA topoisomerase III
MPDQIMITEKASHAKDVRAAVGSRYGSILAAEGHLLDLLEPCDIAPGSNGHPFSCVLMDFFSTHPASGGTKAARCKAIQDALRTASASGLHSARTRHFNPAIPANP